MGKNTHKKLRRSFSPSNEEQVINKFSHSNRFIYFVFLVAKHDIA